MASPHAKIRKQSSYGMIVPEPRPQFFSYC
jgi:hypothetical protein